MYVRLNFFLELWVLGLHEQCSYLEPRCFGGLSCAAGDTLL